MNTIPKNILKQIQKVQKAEITEYHVYKNIAKRTKDEKNRAILERIAAQEKAHYEIWTRVLNKPTKPNRFAIFIYQILHILLGYTFTLKIMEKGEAGAEALYMQLEKYEKNAGQIALEEQEHEKELLDMLDEERLNYVGSIVLGLNDALVELTGAIAGLTLAFADSKIISLSAIITGIAASLSMASSEYLSAKTDNNPNAKKSALYTGVAYIITVAILVLPYLLIPNNHFLSLGIMLASVVIIIFFFNYYISVAKNLPFKGRFWQMVAISLGVSLISFGIGYVVKLLFGIEL
ncbi:MAG: VIT1/CCC1 transporter family protein [Bacilli bacterium]|jgi:VIT1/CCC1 family predicted Fe2+/Mn2+ transporter|nr:VIT1/CCC1 transporter family protein [Bacilli bacterium]